MKASTLIMTVLLLLSFSAVKAQKKRVQPQSIPKHMNFMGIPLSVSVKSFNTKIRQKGYRIVSKPVVNDCYESFFVGEFCGYSDWKFECMETHCNPMDLNSTEFYVNYVVLEKEFATYMSQSDCHAKLTEYVQKKYSNCKKVMYFDDYNYLKSYAIYFYPQGEIIIGTESDGFFKVSISFLEHNYYYDEFDDGSGPLDYCTNEEEFDMDRHKTGIDITSLTNNLYRCEVVVNDSHRIILRCQVRNNSTPFNILLNDKDFTILRSLLFGKGSEKYKTETKLVLSSFLNNFIKNLPEKNHVIMTNEELVNVIYAYVDARKKAVAAQRKAQVQQQTPMSLNGIIYELLRKYAFTKEERDLIDQSLTREQQQIIVDAIRGTMGGMISNMPTLWDQMKKWHGF